VVVLAAGVLATPHLLLASELERVNPAGHAVGRFLMRHCNGLVYGFFRRPPNPAREFHKQIGIHDFYFGHPDIAEPRGKLGCIQQVMAPPIALVQARVPALIGRVLALGVDYVTGLLAIAEDTPQLANGVTLDRTTRDAYGMPLPVVRHDYARRDVLARRALLRQSKRVLRRAGARFFYVHSIETFSHAVGTVRMGADPSTSPLDELGRYRGVRNLWVTDGSVMPTSAAVNPSLTISAIALRAGDAVARGRCA
jgi:hypothetical protein